MENIKLNKNYKNCKDIKIKQIQYKYNTSFQDDN